MATPNQFQLKQMEHQMKTQGGISDHYKNLFGASYTVPGASTQTATATPTAAPTQSSGASYTAPAPGSQASHQAYINREGNPYGGMEGYTANQQSRYDQAYAAGDQDLINRLNDDAQRVGYTLNAPAPKPVVSSTSYTPPSTPYMQLTPQQIQQEASYQIGKERSDLKNTVDNMIAGLKNNAQYANQQIQDNRALEDVSRQQTANPFGNFGRTSFNEGLIGRQRSIDDTYRATNLENEMMRIQNDLYNFDKLSADKQRSLINEMTRIERDYGLQVGQLTGNFNGQRTLAGQQLDWQMNPNNPANVGQNIANRIAQVKLDNLPQQTQLELQRLQQQVNAGDIDNRTAEWQLNELTDPNSITNQAKALQLQMQQLEAKHLPEAQRLELQKIRKQIAEIGKVQPVSEYEAEMQRVKLETAKAELAKLQEPAAAKEKTKTKNELESEYYTNLDSLNEAQLRQFFQNEKSNIIADLGKSGYDDLKAAYGIYD